MSYLFWLGASAEEADRVLSPSATEPVVSAHSGNAPSRCSRCGIELQKPRSDSTITYYGDTCGGIYCSSRCMTDNPRPTPTEWR